MSSTYSESIFSFQLTKKDKNKLAKAYREQKTFLLPSLHNHILQANNAAWTACLLIAEEEIERLTREQATKQRP